MSRNAYIIPFQLYSSKKQSRKQPILGKIKLFLNFFIIFSIRIIFFLKSQVYQCYILSKNENIIHTIYFLILINSTFARPTILLSYRLVNVPTTPYISIIRFTTTKKHIANNFSQCVLLNMCVCVNITLKQLNTIRLLVLQC